MKIPIILNRNETRCQTIYLSNNYCAEPDQPGFVWIRQKEEEGLDGRDLEVVEGVGEEVVADPVSDPPITRRKKTQVLGSNAIIGRLYQKV